MLSLDFLVGFTIFLLALIMVVSMVPGLLVGLGSSGIDYDAVAYRTGVILVEDPGWPASQRPTRYLQTASEVIQVEDPEPASPGWELIDTGHKEDIERMGLAVSRDAPNILLSTKVEKFFNDTFFDEGDYRDKAIFGDIPYSYSISLLILDDDTYYYMASDPLPLDYGYIRRVVKIKEPSAAVIDLSSYEYGEGDPTNQQTFTVQLDLDQLQNQITNPAYQIDPRREPVSVTITGFSSNYLDARLKNVTFNKTEPGFSPVRYEWLSYDEEIPELYTLHFGEVSHNLTPNTLIPEDSSLELVLKPAFTSSFTGSNSILDIQFNFEMAGNPGQPCTIGTFLYDYGHVSPPPLKTGVLEVAIW